MKRAMIILPERPRAASPFETELDRILHLRVEGYITAAEFRASKAAIEKAKAERRL